VADFPLGYKLSWSSRGVLLALRSDAKFYKDGKVEEVPGTDLMGTAKPYFIYPGFAFVAYPNRDSTVYRERYHIPEAQTVIRGTLRYQGFPEMIRVLIDIGFLSEAERDFLKPSDSPIAWKEATQKILKASSGSEKDLYWAISSKTDFRNTEEKYGILSASRWIGLFSDDKIIPRGNPLDTLGRKCNTDQENVTWSCFSINSRSRTKTAPRRPGRAQYAIIDPNGYSSMARLVGVKKQVLDGTISEKVEKTI
jgi:saccharopine dehydrogenase (NADP+, L-glutamate forming)